MKIQLKKPKILVQMIEQLQKQKENIIQRKNEFMNKAEENGLDSETIKAM